jgi:hypothetical protein
MAKCRHLENKRKQLNQVEEEEDEEESEEDEKEITETIRAIVTEPAKIKRKTKKAKKQE